MKYKVGDRVLIRQWDDMAKEFRVNSDGDIDMRGKGCYFTNKMKHLCGNIFIIKEIHIFGYHIEDRHCYIIDEMIERKVNDMTKADLKGGMVCKLRNGTIRIMIGNILSGLYGWSHINDYNDDLTNRNGSNGFDIVEIYEIIPGTINHILEDDRLRTLLWKREEPKEMTVAEIEKELGYPVKIVNGDKQIIF